ncbi:MFS transporter [Vibrio panuliri]|uniref:Multidrug transporter subunit MdtL n=1 Tax=Vibrio panuliri TaxID=1381081 RepID=A0ABX3FK08_9VIBR|nr:MFS transporter [Vibrio panuliri]KAB1457862.1 MFS transporter [Vibrio panuliri]OLQ94511.1 multidrug transporter subunit MdtL [Vibrio panuliri]
MFRVLLSSFFLVLLYPTAIDLYLVGLPQIAVDLNASESHLHMAFSIYLVGMAVTMLFAGKIADSMGRKPVAVVGSLVFIMASLLAGWAQDTTLFFIARFTQGIGAGSCYVVAFAILRDSLDDQRRAKVLSMINGITCIVPVIAPVVGHLIMLQFPWQTLFNVMAGMGIAVCFISTMILKETRHHTQVKCLSSLQNQECFINRFFLSRLLISAIGVTTILTYVNVSPIIIMGELGLSRADYSSMMAGMALISMLTSFLAPIALRYLEQRTLMLTSQSLLLVAAVVLAMGHFHFDTYMSYVIGCSLICFGFSIGFGVTMSQALTPFAQRAGVASSLLAIAQVCCSAFYIWLMGLIGVNALNMLILITVSGGIISLPLILWTPQATQENHYEEISRAS